MSMEDINFIYNNLINNITEKYILTDDLSKITFDMNYLNIIHTLDEIKFLNPNLEYLQKTLLMINSLIQCNRISIKKDSHINQLKIQLQKCIDNTLLSEGMSAFCFKSETYGSTALFPISYVYLKYFGIFSNPVYFSAPISSLSSWRMIRLIERALMKSPI